MNKETTKYINNIRNKGKRDYAVAYNQFYTTCENEPDYRSFGIKTMTAQSVRMMIRLTRDMDDRGLRTA